MISQREAQRLRKRVHQLERAESDRRSSWTKEWPDGIDIGRTKLNADDKLVGSLITARKLKHAVLAMPDTDGSVYFLALPL